MNILFLTQAPEGASAPLLEALEAANKLRAAARQSRSSPSGAPQARQHVLAALAALKRVAPDLAPSEKDACDVAVVGDLRVSSDRIVAAAARALRHAWKDEAPPAPEAPRHSARTVQQMASKMQQARLQKMPSDGNSFPPGRKILT